MGDESKKLSAEEIKALAQQEGQQDIPEELVEKIAQKLQSLQEEKEQRERRKEELTEEVKKILPNFVDFKEDYDVEDLERIVEYLRGMRFNYAKRVIDKPAKKRSFKNFLFLAVGTVVIGVVLFLAKVTFWG